MVFYDGIKGIAGDRVFMDHFYAYKKLKLECETAAENIDEKKRTYCDQYLAAMEQCIAQINVLCIGDIQRNFLNWLRWNQLIIFAEFCCFKEETVFCADQQRIKIIEEKIVALLEVNFQLDEAQKGISNEYAHAFEQIQRKERNFENISARLIQQAARLLINYINLLTQKCYTKIFDRDDYSFERLQSEGDYLTSALRKASETQLACDVEETVKNYIDFCEMDSGAAILQDEQMKKALNLAHKRATENMLQTALRQIRDTIAQIEERAREKMKKLVQAKTVLLSTVMHPVETLKSLKDFVTSPIESTKALIKYAKEHPFQFGALVLGGVLIGLCPGALIGGAVFVADVAITAISIPVVTLSAFAITTAVSSSAIINCAVTAAEIGKIETEVENQIELQKTKEAKIIAENEAEGERISDDAINDRIRRENYEKIEELIKKQNILMKECKEARNQEIENMEIDELLTSERELKNTVTEIENELEKNQEKSKSVNEKLKEMQEKAAKINEGKAAAASIIKDLKEQNSSSAYFLDSDEEDFETVESDDMPDD